jgi:ornithine cyclodeaminase/alanine dehydrogenase-like protein (mu-crystallin family)
MAIFLTNQEVRSLLPMKDCVELMARVFQDEADGKSKTLPRQHIPLPVGFHRTISGVAEGFGVYGMKTYGAVRKEGWLRTRYLVMLYSLEDGLLQAIMEARDIGQIRTGAVAGLATRILSREDAHTIGIIGTGWEARSQIAAMNVVRDITHVKAYSRSPENREKFANEMHERYGVDVQPVATAEEATRDVDIFITITGANDPLINGAWLSPGTHINAVGATTPNRRELDVESVRRSDLVVVEQIEQAQADAAELFTAVEEGALNWDDVVLLKDLVSGPPQIRTASVITQFNSLGVATEDLAAAAFVAEKAKEAGIGIELPFA